MEKAAWLVDMGYVVKASRGAFPLDYVRAAAFLKARLGAVHPFLFNGYDQRIGVTEGLTAFYRAMEHQGMVVRLHPMSGEPSLRSHTQRRVDVDLAAHLVWQAGLAENGCVVLTTGDQDFVPAVELVTEHCQTRVVLFSYRQNVHRDLEAAVAERICFEDFKEQLLRD